MALELPANIFLNERAPLKTVQQSDDRFCDSWALFNGSAPEGSQIHSWK